MATVTFIRYKSQSAAATIGVAQYVSQDSKTNDGQLVSGQNCSPQFAWQEFLAMRQMHRKDSPVWFYHYVQSFSPTEDITAEQAHELAKEFAAKAWPESEVLIATHTDAEHLHSHFIVNSTCFDSGRMLRQGPTTLKGLRQISDELCLRHGLSVLPPSPKRGNGMSAREYRSAVKGMSWKLQLAITVEQCMRYAADRDDFISLMASEGYQVRWTDARKNITYIVPSGMKCCDDKLHEEKYLKGNMANEFGIRQEILSLGAEAADGSEPADGAGHAELREPDREELAGTAEHRTELSDADAGAGADTALADDAGGHRTVSANAGEFDAGASGKAGGNERRVCKTGWEPEREVFLRLGCLAQGSANGSRSGATSDYGCAERVSAQRQIAPYSCNDFLRRADRTLRLGADIVSLIDDGSDVPDEIRARIEAENFGTTVGIIAGTAIALYEKAHSADEVNEPELDEPRWEQKL